MARRKLTRFTEAADGSLVYASTGARAPSDYFLVRDASGRPVGVYRVADNSVGRVRVGSFQAQKNLPKKQRDRVRKAQSKRGFPEGDIGPSGPRGPGLLFPKPQAPKKPQQPQAPQAPKKIQPGMRDAAAEGLLSIQDRGMINFDRRLNALVKDGKMTREEQDELLSRYLEGDQYERRRLWDDLNDRYAGGKDQRYGSP